jgi:hypothetical protein
MITAKIKEYAAIAFAMLMAIVTFGLYARHKGVASMQANVDNADATAAAATINTAQLESRHATDVEVSKLPDAPAQTVATADPATAAGRLRDDGFTRD